MADDKKEQKEEKLTPKPVKVSATVIENADSGQVIIDVMGELFVVPQSQVKDGKILADDLEKATPYGLPLRDLLKVTLTPVQLAHELRRRGVFTKTDVMTNRQAVLSAFITAINPDLRAFLKAVQEYKE